MTTAKQTPLPELDIVKAWSAFKMPGFDVEAIVAYQKRNIEVLTEANRLLVEGTQAVAKRQAEMVNAGLERTVKAAQDLVAAPKPVDKAAKQVAFAQDALQLGLSNARELSEMIARTATAAVELCGRRYTESFDEAQKLFPNGLNAVR